MPGIRIQISDELAAELRDRIAAGEFTNASVLIGEALRYYLDRHQTDAWQEYVRKEIAWSREHARR